MRSVTASMSLNVFSSPPSFPTIYVLILMASLLILAVSLYALYLEVFVERRLTVHTLIALIGVTLGSHWLMCCLDAILRGRKGGRP